MTEQPPTEAVPRCPSCDALLQRGARFCTACSTRVCPLCGRAVAAEGGFCNYCGLDQHVPLGPRSPGPPPKVDGRGMPGWVPPIGSLLVVLIVVISTLIVRGIKRDVTSGPASFEYVVGMLSTKPILLEQQGEGSVDTDFFAIERRVQICWDLVGGTSGSGQAASFALADARATRPAAAIRNQRSRGCRTMAAPAGNYYVKITAPPGVEWRLTVHEG
jgi:hypothetical protein